MIRWLKFLFECLMFYGCLAMFGLIALLWSLAGAFLHLLLPRRIGVPLGRRTVALLSHWYLGLLRICGVAECDLSALDALREERTLIIAPNHPCLLDMVMMASRLPHMTCIIKTTLRDNPLYGGGVRLTDYICNQPSLAMIRAATAAVSGGSPLLIFPEGTRTGTGAVNRFKGGFALVAKAARAPVQTVFIETDSAFLGKGWPLWKKPAMPVVYRVRLGRRFEVNGEVRAFVGELEEYYRRGLHAEARLESDPARTRPFPAT